MTPLGYIKEIDNKQYIKTVDNMKETMKEQESSFEDDYRETSRFGDKKNNFFTIDNNSPTKNLKHVKQSVTNTLKDGRTNELSGFTDRKFSKIVDNHIQDNTLSLSNITKEQIDQNPNKMKLKGKKLKKYEIEERINFAQTNNIGTSQLSKIENINNSGTSHSNYMLINMNMTPIPMDKGNIESSNNRYTLKQGISKSDLSASCGVNHNIESLMKGSEDYKSGMTPQPIFPMGNYPMIDPNIRPNFDSTNRKIKNRRGERSSKSNSDFSQQRSSISRIFQPSPDRFNRINF